MRSNGIFALFAGAALASLSAGMADQSRREAAATRLEPEPEPFGMYPPRRRSYRAPGRTKKLKAYGYKGSKAAKRATSRGGNPARF